MKVKIDSLAFEPTRAHEQDAGLDLRSKLNIMIPAGGSALIETGTHVELPKGTAGLLVSKSGLNCKRDITSTGLIDEGYTGEIMVKLYNHGTEDYFVRRGDKISQLVIIPVLHEPVELVDSLDTDSEREDSGFGSSGR